jgi:hypothetical protein
MTDEPTSSSFFTYTLCEVADDMLSWGNKSRCESARDLQTYILSDTHITIFLPAPTSTISDLRFGWLFLVDYSGDTHGNPASLPAKT